MATRPRTGPNQNGPKKNNTTRNSHTRAPWDGPGSGAANHGSGKMAGQGGAYHTVGGSRGNPKPASKSPPPSRRAKRK